MTKHLQSGAAYVFKRTGNEWIQEAYIKAENNDPVTGVGDEFGTKVAIYEDTIAIAAPNEASKLNSIVHGENVPRTDKDGNLLDDGAHNSSGAVYLYRRTENLWKQEAYIKPSTNRKMQVFGYSLALDENLLIVGNLDGSQQSDIQTKIPTAETPLTTNNGAPRGGGVYTFKRTVENRSKLWHQESFIKAPNNAAKAEFGSSIATHSGKILVGSPRENGSGTGAQVSPPTSSSSEAARNDSGSAYLFGESD